MSQSRNVDDVTYDFRDYSYTCERNDFQRRALCMRNCQQFSTTTISMFSIVENLRKKLAHRRTFLFLLLFVDRMHFARFNYDVADSQMPTSVVNK